MTKLPAPTDVEELPLRVIAREVKPDRIEVTVEFTQAPVPCRRCGTMTSEVYDRRTQRKRDLMEDDKPVWLVMHKRRFRCRSCGAIFTEPDDLSGPRQRSTKRLRAALRAAAARLPVKQVARRFGVSYRQVRRATSEDGSG